MKLFVILILVLLTINYSNAQNAKDWYWPAKNVNKVTFYTPDVNTANPTNLTKTIYYSDYNNTFQLTVGSLYKGQAALTETKRLAFLGNEVKALSSNKTVDDGPTKTTNFNPAQTIFKLPARGHIAIWVTNGINYQSSWAFLLDGGTKIEAIKVVEDLPRYNGKFISYYVKGYGLVKTANIFSGKTQEQILDKFHTCSYDDLYNMGIVKGKYFFSLSENIFEEISFKETLSRFKSLPESQLSNVAIKLDDKSPLSLITKYEKLVINNIEPNLEGVQTNYDDKDFRVIIWNDKLYNKTSYNNKALKDLGYDYMGVTQSDSHHKTYSYRNCKKNLTFDLTEWYDQKLSIFVSWFSDVVKNPSGRFIGGPSAND